MTTAVDVGQIFQQARAQYGTPQNVLTDNGCIFTAEHRGGKVVLETELERLGVRHKHARPYHPQTCGKVERFHQTQNAGGTHAAQAVPPPQSARRTSRVPCPLIA